MPTHRPESGLGPVPGPEYSQHPAGLAFLLAPILYPFRDTALVEPAALYCCGLATVFGCFAWCWLTRPYTKSRAHLLVAAAVAYLGSPLWHYGLVLYAESFLAALAVGAYAAALRAGADRARRMAPRRRGADQAAIHPDRRPPDRGRRAEAETGAVPAVRAPDRHGGIAGDVLEPRDVRRLAAKRPGMGVRVADGRPLRLHVLVAARAPAVRPGPAPLGHRVAGVVPEVSSRSDPDDFGVRALRRVDVVLVSMVGRDVLFRPTDRPHRPVPLRPARPALRHEPLESPRAPAGAPASPSWSSPSPSVPSVHSAATMSCSITRSSCSGRSPGPEPATMWISRYIPDAERLSGKPSSARVAGVIAVAWAFLGTTSTSTTSGSIGDSSCILSDLAQHPTASIPAACGGYAETAAAYRFFDNDKVDFDGVLRPHRDPPAPGSPPSRSSCWSRTRPRSM